MKKMLAILALLGALSLTACSSSSTTTSTESASADEPIRMVFAAEEYTGEPQDYWMDAFKENLESISGGVFTVETHNCGELGDGSDQAELIQAGTINMGMISTGPASVIIPEMNLFGLHWMLPGTFDEMYDFFDTAESIAMLEDLFADSGLELMSWETEGAYYWTANEPLTTPEEFSKFKMRTMESALIQASFNAYGANATVVAYSELYNALQLGTADGQTNPASAVYTAKFYEVQDYLIHPGSDYFCFTVVANQSFLESLSAEQLAFVEEAVAATSEDYRNYIEANEEECLDLLIAESGMTYIDLSDEQRDAFKALSGGVQDEYVSISGGQAQEILDQLLLDLEKYN